MSVFCFFISTDLTRTEEGFIRLMLLARIIRDYLVFSQQISLFSNDIRRIFNRSRARQKEKNLDITYISCRSEGGASDVARIIAMSWPGSLCASVWTNSIHDVEDFLNRKHMGHSWV